MSRASRLRAAAALHEQLDAESATYERSVPVEADARGSARAASPAPRQRPRTTRVDTMGLLDEEPLEGVMGSSR